MWADNKFDDSNVNERVIVSAAEVAEMGTGSGIWSVRVRSRDLHTETQHVSLVVTGAISDVSVNSTAVSAAKTASNIGDDDEEDPATGRAGPTVIGSSPLLLTAISSLAILAAAAIAAQD